MFPNRRYFHHFQRRRNLLAFLSCLRFSALASCLHLFLPNFLASDLREILMLPVDWLWIIINLLKICVSDQTTRFSCARNCHSGVTVICHQFTRYLRAILNCMHNVSNATIRKNYIINNWASFVQCNGIVVDYGAGRPRGTSSLWQKLKDTTVIQLLIGLKSCSV